MTVPLSAPIAQYFAASNKDDAADAVAACFTADALVHDEAHDHRGRDAIRDWAAEARRKYRFHAEVTGAEPAADGALVTAHLTGDFPGAPADLRYRFKLDDGLIARLEIG